MMLAFRRTRNDADSPPYLSLLQLKKPPFSLNGGDEFFFADPERSQYLDMLQHLTQYGEEMLLVTGDEGIGKSVMLAQYLARAEEHWRVCRLDGGENIVPDRLFTRIAECFTLDITNLDPAALFGSLRNHLEALLEHQLPVLVVDNAQALSDESLELVANLAALEGEHGPLIRVLLFADRGLEPRLAEERFAHLAAPHRIELKPFDESQLAGYLAHRLATAGHRGALPFEEKEFKRLYRQSGGIPAKINVAAHELLLERIGGEGDSRRFEPRQYLKVGVAATAVVGTLLGLQQRINEFFGGDTPEIMMAVAERPVVRLAQQESPWAVVIGDGEKIQISCATDADSGVAIKPIVALAQAGAVPPISLPSPPRDETPVSTEGKADAEAVTAVETPSEEKTPVMDTAPEPVEQVVVSEGTKTSAEQASPVAEPSAEPTPLALKSVLPDPVVASDVVQSITLEGSGFTAESKVAVSWAGKVKVLEPTQMTLRDSEHLEIALATGMQPQTWAVQVSGPDNKRSNVLRFKVVAPEVPKPLVEKAPVAPAVTKPLPAKAEAPVAAKSAPVSPKAAARKLEDAGWISRQPDANYTLQLLASSKRENVDQYVRETPAVRPPLAHFEQLRDGQRLHVLVQGSYKDEASATAAAKKVADLKPWVRDFAGIKQVMAKPEAKTVATTPAVAVNAKDTAWVWSQNPRDYTVQLAGAVDEASIEAVMSGVELPGELAVVQTLREGKPWYVLVYGSFTSRESAIGTISRLPAPLRAASPWARSFASLQEEAERAGVTR